MSGSVLGESWVVASMHTEGKAASSRTNDLPSTQTRAHAGNEVENDLESSSMSGPELIMPSICGTPIAEKSWVAPNVRAKRTSPNLRRRQQTSSESTRTKSTRTKSTASDRADNQNEGSHSATPSKHQTRAGFAFEKPLRTLANIILLTAISHLLILPELVQQYQSVCYIGAISALYPSSCVSTYSYTPFSPHTASHPAPVGAVSSSQARLELLFNATLHEMAPLNNSLKQTESQLQTVERELRRLHPGTKHEANLEFESCWRSIRVAAWKFDSLKVDLQSAVDSLVAAGDVKSSESRPSVAHDARLSTQMLRRENYINQLMARMRSKADSLAVDLATLDDHLESIEGIVDRETKQSGLSYTNQLKDPSHRLGAFVDAIVPSSVTLPSFLRARDIQSDDDDNTSPSVPKLTLPQLFHQSTIHHRPVAGLARNLSKKLQQSPHNK